MHRLAISGWLKRIYLSVGLAMLAGCGDNPSFVTVASGDSTSQNSGDQLGQTASDCKPDDIECLNASAQSQTSRAGSPGADGDEIVKDGITYLLNRQDFKVEKTDKIDILWVVDSSGSMSSEQRLLRENFPTFIEGLKDSLPDFQTAVTSTDVCDRELPRDKANVVCPFDNNNSSSHLRGSFVGNKGSQILSSAMSKETLAEKFSDYADVGTSGSGFEHGLWAAKLAIDKVKDKSNDALMRSDAFLAVIVVSDEEDDGIGLSMEDEQGRNYKDLGQTSFYWDDSDMIRYLNQEKGKGKFAISTITGTRDADGALCRSSTARPREEGTQYINAAKKTGGLVQSICSEDWSDLLGKLSQDFAGQATQFVLDNSAVAKSIRVFVDGKERRSGWKYLKDARAIRFDPGKEPAPGAKIGITYLSPK